MTACALGPVSISDKTSYHEISWSFKAARLVVWIIASLWNLTSTSTVSYCCRGARQISKQLYNSKYKSRQVIRSNSIDWLGYTGHSQSICGEILEDIFLFLFFSCGFFYWNGLILIPALISNPCLVKCGMKLLIHSTVQVWVWISNFIPHCIMDVITYPCLG